MTLREKAAEYYRLVVQDEEARAQQAFNILLHNEYRTSIPGDWGKMAWVEDGITFKAGGNFPEVSSVIVEVPCVMGGKHWEECHSYLDFCRFLHQVPRQACEHAKIS